MRGPRGREKCKVKKLKAKATLVLPVNFKRAFFKNTLTLYERIIYTRIMMVKI